MLKRSKILLLVMIGALAIKSCEKNEEVSSLEETLLETENSYQQIVDLKIESEKISKAFEYSLFKEDGSCEIKPSNIERE